MSVARSRSLAAQRLEHLRSRRPAMVALLERLVRAESPSTDPAAQASCLAILERALESLGFRTRRARGRASGGVLLAIPRVRPRGAPYQLLLGHADTVWPIGTLAEMPLSVADGRLHGPGAYDMKAGLVQGVFAIEALYTGEPAPPGVTPVFLVNTDEEIGSRESTVHVRRLARRADRVFVLEPSVGLDGKLKTARKGIGRFTLTVRGKAAHAGLDPERGVSAILELSHVVQKLFALNDLERGVTVNVGTIDGGLQPNVIAPESRAVADVRVRTREDARRIEAAIHSLQPTLAGTELEIEGRIGRPPMERTPGNVRLWEVARRAGEELDMVLEETLAGGGSDGNTTSQFAPTLDGLGAVGDAAHAPGEFLLLDALVERAALLACLLAHPPLGLRDAGGP